MIGKTLGQYEITGLLGKGGMGEVYRARDARLDRDVALKILPPEMANDPERVARFEREARTLATLQHNNIASVFGFEESGGIRYLAMELVEGEGLDERLRRGAIAVDDCIPMARQICEGLEAAHERGIVHRDLKPANIKLGRDGVVKILDFGLARAFSEQPETQEELENSPTITGAMTQAGTILGTAAYMSPEQAKGSVVDKRADIWAFGAILYEMLSGERLFNAETISETIASVLLTDIRWDALPDDLPASLRALLERCLERDTKSRLRDIGEARIVLADPDASVALRIAMHDPARGELRRRPAWPWLVAVTVALGAGWMAGEWFRSRDGEPTLPPLLFDIPDPQEQMITGSIALSPNGENLVYAHRDSLGREDLRIRRLDEDSARALPHTRGGRSPFWSPDSEHIGFFVNRDLYRTSLGSSASSQIASIPAGPVGGAWGPGDLILVGTETGPIYRVSANGGPVQAVTEVDEAFETAHCWPAFLPDGEHFVFLADASSDEGHRLYVHSLDGSENKILRKALRSAILVDHGGSLLTIHNAQLFAQPFDFSRREFSGPQVLVQDELPTFGQHHESPMTLSHNGVLAFQQGSDRSVIARVALDGSSVETLLPPDRYRNPRVSPDQRRVAFEIQGSAEERTIWVEDLVRGTRTLISERGRMSDGPTWSPDGETLYFDSLDSTGWRAYRKRVYGGTRPELLGAPEGASDTGVLDLTNDERWLLCASNPGDGGMDFYLASLAEDEISWTPWLATAAQEQRACFSPDGQWIIFESDATGQPEVYVSPRDGGPSAAQWLVSVNGGTDPAWSPDGSKLYYRTVNHTLMESTITIGDDDLEFSPPVPLVKIKPPSVGYLRNAYDLGRDGRSVVAFLEIGDGRSGIRLRTGWRDW